MRFLLILSSLMILSACSTTSDADVNGDGLPEDVRRFTEKREMCEYYMAEEPYEFSRREFLRAQLLDTCIGTDQQLAGLRAKYADDADVLRELSVYRDRL